MKTEITNMEIVEKSILINRMGIVQAYMYRTALHDAGRAGSFRPRQKNDCTVRAVALATQIGYDEAYELLAAAGRKCSKGFAFKPWADQAAINGYRFEWQGVRKQRGRPRLGLALFCQLYPTGTYIVLVKRHVLTVIDGVCHDCFISDAQQPVQGFWRVIRDCL